MKTRSSLSAQVPVMYRESSLLLKSDDVNASKGMNRRFWVQSANIN